MQQKILGTMIGLMMVGVLLVTPVGAVAPANDDFASATVIAAVEYTTSQSTADSTLETGEPEPCGAINATVWFAFTAPADMTLLAETVGSDFDTVLAVHTGTDVGDLETIGCNDDTGNSLQSRLSWPATAGETYRIQVGGFDGETGTLELRVLETIPPEHDLRANAKAIVAPAYRDETFTYGAALEPGEADPGCGWMEATVWYRYEAAATSLVRLTTADSDFDTVIAVYADDGSAVLPFDCDDDGGPGLASALDFVALGGTTYHVQVGGYGGATGALVFGADVFETL